MALLGYGICFDVSRYLAVEGVISRRTLGNDSKIIGAQLDRKSTRLNSSHDQISYAVFCLKKKTVRQPVLASVSDYPVVERTNVPARSLNKHRTMRSTHVRRTPPHPAARPCAPAPSTRLHI